MTPAISPATPLPGAMGARACPRAALDLPEVVSTADAEIFPASRDAPKKPRRRREPPRLVDDRIPPSLKLLCKVPGLNKCLRPLLRAIDDRCWGEGRYNAWDSDATLAETIGVSMRTVQHLLLMAERWGLILRLSWDELVHWHRTVGVPIGAEPPREGDWGPARYLVALWRLPDGHPYRLTQPPKSGATNPRVVGEIRPDRLASSCEVVSPDRLASSCGPPSPELASWGSPFLAIPSNMANFEGNEVNPSNSREGWFETTTDGFASLSRGEEGKGLGVGRPAAEMAPTSPARPVITADADYDLLAAMDGASDKPAAPAPPPPPEANSTISDRRRGRTAPLRAPIGDGPPSAKQLADAGAFYQAGGAVREMRAIPVFRAAGIVGPEAIEAYLAKPSPVVALRQAATSTPEPDPDYARLAALDGVGDKPTAIPGADAVPTKATPTGVVKFAGLEAVMDRAMRLPGPASPPRANPPSRHPVATPPRNPAPANPPSRAGRKATVAELSERAKGFDRALPSLPSLAEAIRFAEDLCECFRDGNPERTIPLWAQDFQNPFPFGQFAEKIKQMDAPGIDSPAAVLNTFIVAVRRKREASA